MKKVKTLTDRWKNLKKNKTFYMKIMEAYIPLRIVRENDKE